MTLAFLDINDCSLQLWHRHFHLKSPGYALLKGQDYEFGGTARSAARLRPRDINTRYWWQLSTETLQPALGPARHTADLVHAHLLQLHREAGEPGEVLIAASGSMQREQLALLLGIVQQCPFDAVGLVNRSSLLGSLHGNGGRLFHLELQLHQALLSELAPNGRDITLQRTVPLPGCGLLQLQERLVEIVAASFIRQTRFDPRRKAATEQQLYDSLPAALQALAQSGETNVEINGYRARISRADLEGAGQPLFESAAQAMGSLQAGDRIVADPLIGLLPGFSDPFTEALFASDDALWQAAQQHGEQLRQPGQALSFISTLPSLQSDAAAPIEPVFIAPAPPPVTAPTHLLRGHTALQLDSGGTPLDDGGEIYRGDSGWQLRKSLDCRVNDAPYTDGQLLAAGDVIVTGSGTQLCLIEVQPGGS